MKNNGKIQKYRLQISPMKYLYDRSDFRVEVRQALEENPVVALLGAAPMWEIDLGTGVFAE
jgi:hypothetical protein